MGILTDFAKEVEDLVSGLSKDLFGEETSDPQEEASRTILRLKKLTPEDNPDLITLRALKVYLAIANHVKSGGAVKFTGNGPDKTLKVRLR